jgi:hypothetical protein
VIWSVGILAMKSLGNRKLFSALAILAILTMVFSTFNAVPALAATIIIAASDSSSTWKSQATAVCTGVSDQNTINTYLINGNTVELASGTFNVDYLITMQGNTHLYGQGNTSIINLQSGAGYISISQVSNVELDHLEISGNAWYNVAAVWIYAAGGTQSNFSIHDITCTALGTNDFYAYAGSNGILSNLSFYNCDASAPDGMGFALSGEGTNPLIENVSYYNCTVENAGIATTRLINDGNCWTTGFDLAEYSGLTVNRIYVMKCSVNGAWESDFHLEGAPTVYNMVYTGCSATNAGEKVGGALFGAGFLVNGTTQDVVYNGNTTSSNANGDINAWNGSSYTNVTPIQNEIYPVGSSKTASGVTQGNCSGVIINTDSTHKELVLYSNNGNLVNQQIELGATYIGDDGNTYTFNDTKIVAQFTNYEVIRLVKSNLSVTTSSLPNGTMGVAYSQTMAATGGMTPYTWIITTGTLPAGLTLSSSGVISGTPTTAGGPTSVTCRVTDSASATATKSLSITINSSPPSITTSSLWNGTVGVAYSQTMAATGGTSPYTWTITTGTLPLGLTLSSSGVISGTPTTASGPTSLTFKVTDSTGAVAAKSLTITINSTTPSITTSSLPNGTVGVTYSQTLAATGGTSPYTWTITAGTLPAGLSLSSSGIISGTPTTAGGPASLTFRVTDSASATTTKSLSITVNYAAWDVNKDGTVNVLDMISISQHWDELGIPGWITQDVNGDGVVNTLDMIIIGQHWTA